ncbi:hypothetical protein IFO70_16400 [Phormidium tenue FACHB-886]|nr:hypothetical protein [Phormidium tenue FACHB-886]
MSSKPKKLALAIPLAMGGAVYFAAFAGLDVHPVLKQQLVLLPVQVGVLIYLLGWRDRAKASELPLDK